MYFDHNSDQRDPERHCPAEYDNDRGQPLRHEFREATRMSGTAYCIHCRFTESLRVRVRGNGDG